MKIVNSNFQQLITSESCARELFTIAFVGAMFNWTVFGSVELELISNEHMRFIGILSSFISIIIYIVYFRLTRIFRKWIRREWQEGPEPLSTFRTNTQLSIVNFRKQEMDEMLKKFKEFGDDEKDYFVGEMTRIIQNE